MRSLRGAIIARRTGCVQALWWLTAVLVLAPAGTVPAAGGAAPGAAARSDVTGTDWDELEKLVHLICFLLNCPSGRGTGMASRSMDSVTIQDIEGQVVEYLSAGLRPDLTPEERAQGDADAASVQTFLEAHPGMLPPDLHVDYYVILEAMRHDLKQ